MTAPSEVPAIIETVVRYECPKCGNNCQCGVPYVPKTMRAAEAIKANPETSNRAIAKEIGADKVTVDRARKKLEQSGDVSPVAERIGLDNVARKVPEPEPPAATFLDKPWLALAANEGEPAAADDDEQGADADEKEKPDRIVTKAELMPLLKAFLKYSADEDDCWREIPDADLELCDALEEAETVLRSLHWDARNNPSVEKAINQRDEAEKHERKAQRKIDHEKAKEIEPEIRERAKTLGYDELKVHGAGFRFKKAGLEGFSIEVDRIYGWLETHEAEARAEAEAAE
jgi:hypothetical protein